MAKVKLTPKDRKTMVARVKSGEKQADVARDYGITQGYLSKIVKQAEEKVASDVFAPVPQQMNMSGFTSEQLRNRYKQIQVELLKQNEELKQRHLEADALQRSIEIESAKADDVRDESWIMAQKKRLTWCQDTTRITREVVRLHQEVIAIAQTLLKRGEDLPVLTLLSAFR